MCPVVGVSLRSYAVKLATKNRHHTRPIPLAHWLGDSLLLTGNPDCRNPSLTGIARLKVKRILSKTIYCSPKRTSDTTLNWYVRDARESFENIEWLAPQ